MSSWSQELFASTLLVNILSFDTVRVSRAELARARSGNVTKSDEFLELVVAK